MKLTMTLIGVLGMLALATPASACPSASSPSDEAAAVVPVVQLAAIDEEAVQPEGMVLADEATPAPADDEEDAGNGTPTSVPCPPPPPDSSQD